MAVPSSDVSALRSLKQALLSSMSSHRCVLGAAMMAVLPSAQALAQCVSTAPNPLSQGSGACVESNVTRNGAGAQGAISVSNSASYTGTGVTLTAPSGVTTVTVNNAASLLLTDGTVTADGAAGLRQFGGAGELRGTVITSTATGNATGVDVRSGTLTIGSSASGATQITATSSGTSSGAGVALQTTGTSAVINATDAILHASGQSTNTNAGAFATAGTINLTGGSILVSGSGSNGLWGNSGTTINANGVNIQAGLYGAITSGTITLGLDTRGPTAVHTVINAGRVGIYATGGSVTGIAAEVIAGNTGVIVAQAGKVDLTGGSITAVTGVTNTDLTQGGTFTSNGVAITTTGTGVSTAGASSVTTLQDNGNTHTTITAGGTALRVTAGASAIGTNVVLTTTGAAGIAFGAYAQGATIDLTGGSVTAQGADGAGIFADTAATITARGTAISTTAAATNASGARATRGGAITLIGTPSNGVTVSTEGTGSHGLNADAGGLITGSYTSVSTTGADAIGVRAVGTGSSVTLSDSEVNTELDNAHGAYAASGGTIVLTRTAVTTLGAGAGAAYANAGGAITLNNSNMFSSGDNASAAVALGAGSRLTLNNSYVSAYGNNSAGLLAVGGGTIAISGGGVVTGDYRGGTIIANSPGMLAQGAGSSIQASNGASSATYGANSPGIWADAGGRIDFSGYGVFTYQPNSPGALASGTGSTVTLTNIINRTTGPSSAGIRVVSAGTVIVTGSEVTTGYRVTGNDPPALQFPDAQIGLEAHGADVVGAGSRLQAENSAITTHGDGAIGVRVSQGGTAAITGGTITTHGADTSTVGGADGVRSTDVGSSIALTGTSVTTTNINAVGLHTMAGGAIAATDVTVATQGQNAFGASAQDAGSTIALTRSAIATAGARAHGIATVNGGMIAASDTTVAVRGAGSSTIYVTGSTPSTVSVTGGGLSATDGAIVRAEGGTGTVSISGGTAITPAVMNGRPLLAQVTGDAVGTPSNLTLNINGIPALAGDILVDPSTLAYNLGNSNWTGNLVLSGPGNAASANLNTSQWTGDLLADAGNTANVALAQGSLWTGLARNATNVAIDARSAWNVTGDSNATGIVSNAGLIQFLPRTGAYSTLTVGNYVGSAGSRIGFNTYLGADGSPSNVLVINGGRASGTSSVWVSNTGGLGALTVADGIRLVQVTGGGTTTTDAFTLGRRVAAGAYEYELFRGGSTDPNDWFLRSHLIATPTNPTAPSGPDIPLYRPEVPLYAPIPAIARQMALSTLGTLHERVGEEENLRGGPEARTYANGVWGRVFGERVSNRWAGTVDASATGNLIGFQTGFDILRRTTDSGHRDHAGMYMAYSDYNTPSVRGFALGIQSLAVGKLQMNGPSVGAYWTHFGPGGWYLDAVFQTSWYDASASSLYGAGISTKATAYTASLEAGYPIHFGEGNRWLIEPQAQIVYQGVSVNRSQDQYSSVAWNAGPAWTGRLGARLQYTGRDERGILWQPYARVNLWHAFSGNDGTTFGSSSPIIKSSFGDTALEVAGGVTARVNQNVSVYGQASHRWTLDGSRSRQSATTGTFGVRVNW
ncbi:autotransporter outer membrane beta-barrel domain-containing protein [Phreatobacter sp. AB_2022a]|uniref:autotransporter outer membrane beta-barrel domain-containing protein n=1 Tax=Phreatobacter sp. AB_2022a TaxID=3003134 RepID=UPI0022873630|nr:autotransporter outer membrane beta-barrel domain-containing protein [Phreatobacter sp. AB_2022a]MCZ0737083.1 autotransporter outer membrane beta-barrel domain-containing protein [Phreatobacter sp. AB_2022a]